MASIATLRVYTGSGAGTESASVTGVDLISADNATNSSPNRAANEVALGTNSFEKWLRVRIDDADGLTLTNFWIERAGDLPDGVIVKFGVTDTPATPTASTSTVATTTMVDGRRYFFDNGEYSADGDHTRYVVMQAQVAADATTGAIDSQTLQVSWSE